MLSFQGFSAYGLWFYSGLEASASGDQSTLEYFNNLIGLQCLTFIISIMFIGLLIVFLLLTVPDRSPAHLQAAGFVSWVPAHSGHLH